MQNDHFLGAGQLRQFAPHALPRRRPFLNHPWLQESSRTYCLLIPRAREFEPSVVVGTVRPFRPIYLMLPIRDTLMSIDSPSMVSDELKPSAGASCIKSQLAAESLRLKKFTISPCDFAELTSAGQVDGNRVLDLEAGLLAQVLHLVHQFAGQAFASQIFADLGADADGPVPLGFDRETFRSTSSTRISSRSSISSRPSTVMPIWPSALQHRQRVLRVHRGDGGVDHRAAWRRSGGRASAGWA